MIVTLWGIGLLAAAVIVLAPSLMLWQAGSYNTDPTGLDIGAVAVAAVSAAFLLPAALVHVRDHGPHTGTTALWWTVGGCLLLAGLAGASLWVGGELYSKLLRVPAIGCGVGVVVMLIWAVLRALDGLAAALKIGAGAAAVLVLVAILAGVVLAFQGPRR